MQQSVDVTKITIKGRVIKLLGKNILSREEHYGFQLRTDEDEVYTVEILSSYISAEIYNLRVLDSVTVTGTLDNTHLTVNNDPIVFDYPPKRAYCDVLSK